MQQPCQSCGFISDRPSRFCRQCGAPLFVENEATSAATRSYAPDQNPSSYLDRPYISPYAGSGNPEVANTTRFYNPPVGVDPSIPAQKKSRAWIWVLASLLCLLFFVGTGAAVFFIAAKRAQPRSDVGTQIEDQVKQSLENEFNKVKEELARADKERDQGLKEADQGLKVAKEVLKSLPQLLPTVTHEMPKGLEKYRYPKSDLEDVTSVFGNEIVRMSTDDDIDQVKNFYQTAVGQTAIKDETDDETLIFQIPGSPAIKIGVSPDKADPDKTQIFIWRSKLPQPKQNR